MHAFHVDHTHVHLKWSNAITPVQKVDSGSTLTYDLLDGGHNQITPTSTVADVVNFDSSLADPVFGPIYINGAEPGDVLAVEFLSLKTADYGWTALFERFGLLRDEFPEPALKIWDLKTHENYTVFKEGIHIPIRPFLGVVGIAPEAAGEFDTVPPYDTGGNIDCKHITAGSTLYLPVKVAGALLSLGGGHAAQGDGEVCGTAIETPMKAEIKVTVQKNKPWVKSPHYVNTGVDAAAVQNKGEYAALGIDQDLKEAARKGLRGLIDWLVAEKGLTRVEAYMLVSVAGDLRISEAVDMPHYAVACSIPLNIFVGP